MQYSFAQKTSHILRFSTHLTLKIICYRNTAKNLSDFTNFSANKFRFGVRKNICTALSFDAQELHSWSTLKANFCIFLYISLRKILFQKRNIVKKRNRNVKFYLVRVGWGRPNNFFKEACCLGPAKCFIIFDFSWNFGKFNYFSAFRYFYL